METNCVRVLLDNCIMSGAEFAEPVTMKETVSWGNIQDAVEVVCYKKKVFDDIFLQEELDAIVTIGRLIREGAVAAHTYCELDFESFRRSKPIKAFYALNGCPISHCPSPIERSKFRQTVNFAEHISKGGKKDKKKGMGISNSNQIPFIEWLLHLDKGSIQSILSRGKDFELTEFEEDSFRQIDWLRFICNRFGSPENYPDAFHLWTAERNKIDVFLTLERKLPNIVDQIRRSKEQKHPVRTSVLRPIAFLQSMGISKLDDVPIKAGQFYNVLDDSPCKAILAAPAQH